MGVVDIVTTPYYYLVVGAFGLCVLSLMTGVTGICEEEEGAMIFIDC